MTKPPLWRSLPTLSLQNFLALLDRCTAPRQVDEVQARIFISGLHAHPFLIGKLVATLAVRLNDLSRSLFLFEHLPKPLCNVFTWNSLIRGLAISTSPVSALHQFDEMRHWDLESPDAFTYTAVFKACGCAQARQAAEAAHGLAAKAGAMSSLHVANAALHAYTECGDVASATRLFEQLLLRNTVSWNAMITGYAQNGLAAEALGLLKQMLLAEVWPTEVTAVGTISACSQVKNFCFGAQVHCLMHKSILEVEKRINPATALIDMYGKCGFMKLSTQVFREMGNKDMGAWSSLIGSFVSNGFFKAALQHYQDMAASGFRPDEPALVNALCACAHLGELEHGKNIHEYMKKRFPSCDAALGTALITMYSKCGCLGKARDVFDDLPRKDTRAWTSMISGLADHGNAREALELFSLMKKSSGVRPDGVTFVGVLSACSHAGLVEDGIVHFHSMKANYNIVPRIEHYGCMIDLFGRAGRLKEALELNNSMDVRGNAVVWRALLSACRVNLDIEVAEAASQKLVELGSNHCGDYVLLSSIFAAKGRWGDAKRVREQMEGSVVKKPALSSIEKFSKI